MVKTVKITSDEGYQELPMMKAMKSVSEVTVMAQPACFIISPNRSGRLFRCWTVWFIIIRDGIFGIAFSTSVTQKDCNSCQRQIQEINTNITRPLNLMEGKL
jgi:hypothetical protein